ncbi:hypothetical protein UR09_05105 [Candidatus Nitromaritima sp. SCGC AAA799-A02]|nr:hypothetical protein UR09_05105 [Candidatus Nitromaritima sp. SCGC AAA799-A02]
MTSDPAKSQISSLIRLLDDRDESIRKQVRDKLIEWREDALPFLEIAARTEGPGIKPLILEVIKAIHPKQLEEQFRQLAATSPGGNWDLEAGVTLLDRFGHPEGDADRIGHTLDRLAAELSDRLPNEYSPEEAVNIMTRFLFHEKGFEGNQADYFDLDNTYFTQVLERRRGIPITLSALCIFVARRLGLPVVGVGLPGHYLVKYDSLTDPVFFDPFSRGRVLSRDDCARLAEVMGYQIQEHHLIAATDRETLVRMMNNLIMIYNKGPEAEKARQLGEFIKVLSGGPQRNTPIQPA